MGLKIVFFGSSLVSAYWNGAATYYRGLIRALHARGHSITFFEPDAYDRQRNRDIDDPEYACSVVYEADEGGVKRALQMVERADVIVKTSGVGVFDSMLEEQVLAFQKGGSLVVFWDVDAPATLDRVNANPTDPFRSLIREYDLIFTYGGGEPVVSAYRALGARDCVPVYNALDPDTHCPSDTDHRFEGTLGFLGNRLPDREERVREFFFGAAKGLPDRLFILGGNGWDRCVPDLNNVRRIGHVYTHEHNAFNCSNLAVLNINRQSMARYGFSPPTRIFEAAGAGACIITDAWDGVDQFLTPGKECLVAQNGDAVINHLVNLCAADARRIGTAARERVLDEHTYRIRAELVEKCLWSCKANHKEVAL